MGKQEIINALTTSGEISVFRRSPNWEKAFKLYSEVNGRHKSMSCGSCYREVLQWLKS